MSTQLITALDFPDAVSAVKMVETIGKAGDYYKIGLELFISEGHIILPYLKNAGKKIFLDLKIHDIPNTAAQAFVSCMKYDVDMLNVHAQGGVEMMRRCSDVVEEYCAKSNKQKPLLIAVTLLTSLDEAYLKSFDIAGSPEEYVLKLAEATKEAGFDGVVSSAKETAAVKIALGKKFLTVTPGIRPAGGDMGDQKRVLTPADAAKMRTDYIVVGRPITQAANPKAALEGIKAELEKFA